MTRIRALLAGVGALAALSLSDAHAQQTQTPEPPAATPDLETAEEPCEIVPRGDTPTAPTDSEQQAESDQDESLSATLDRCGGVLTPPAVGDPQMVEPAPDEGVTPIIPPSAVPEQR